VSRVPPDDSVLPPIRQELRRAGLRVTAPRVVVLARLREAPHSSADELLAWAETRAAAISRQGMYDVLASLEKAGLVRRIEPAGHASRYETRVADNHHHVICRSCGTIADVDCAVGAMPCVQPSSPSGFTVEEAEINFWGLCPSCRTASSGPEPSGGPK
jgi:Fur family transcriptional regulator, stress-responsive regulator